MSQKSFVELRETFVELRVIFNGLFYTKLHEEDTKLHEVILDKSYLLRHPQYLTELRRSSLSVEPGRESSPISPPGRDDNYETRGFHGEGQGIWGFGDFNL